MDLGSNASYRYGENMMRQPVTLDDALDAAERLEPEDQAELVSILSRRLAERGRQRVIASVAEANQEYDAGQCRSASPKDLIDEALS